MEGDSLAKLAKEMRAWSVFTSPGPDEWAARLDALRERVLKCQTDEYEYIDKEIRSIAGAVSVGETIPE